MKPFQNILYGIMSVVLALSIIFMNFSFATEKRIEIKALSLIDGHTLYKLSDNDVHVVTPEDTFVLTNVDSCEVLIHLYGFGWTTHTKHSTNTTKVEVHNIEFVSAFQTFSSSESKRQRHRDFRLRFLAVSAPFFVSAAGNPNNYRLDSRTPFSIQNAVRLGAQAAITGQYIWGQSNWSDPELLRDSVFLLNYQDEDMGYFVAKLEEIRPQVLFLGSMTLSFPGAIHLASIAKQTLGENVFIILGGKHVNETIYLEHNVVRHHVGSPTLLMQQERIPKVFDLVVSGDGEEVARRIGECIGEEILHMGRVGQFSNYTASFDDQRGKFILSWIENGTVCDFQSKGVSLDYTSLPSPVSLFGVNTNFPVFGTEHTAHVYSDMGKGCVFDCFFCSERSTINGKVDQNDPAQRLYNQIRDAGMFGKSMSAFVEDSILLMGNPTYLNRLAGLLEANPLHIPFGGQFTVDNLLDHKVRQSITRLTAVGLCYVYTGMETFDEKIAEGFSKNTKKRTSWIDRNLEAMRFLSEQNLKYGVSLLWGLGESQEDRLQHLSFLSDCRKQYGIPIVISMNWATQHPLFNLSSFDYVDWGTARDSQYLPFLTRLFGEASEKYVLTNGTLPTVEQLSELEQKFQSLSV